LEDVADKIAHAKSVLLVGGGPVAVELAGEIKSKYPNQEHSDKIKHELEKLGVKVKLRKNFNISNKKEDSFHVLSPPRSYEGLDGSLISF
jgi:NADH dehydrogenase FAD-containing subunit